MGEKQRDVTLPHGREQSIKMDIMGMIHSAENPFDIIYHVAKYLEKESSEDGYAQAVRDNMRAVYGLALLDEKLMADELKDVEERLGRIRRAYDSGDFTEEEKKRINYAITLHEANIQRLKDRIHEAEVNGTSLYMEKG
ncbi:MAG: hypothetical protein ACTTJE_04510 [Schwartzia sp. (in: firmicutes)]